MVLQELCLRKKFRVLEMGNIASVKKTNELCKFGRLLAKAIKIYKINCDRMFASLVLIA